MKQFPAIPSRTASFSQRTTPFIHALAFVAGFSLIFIVGWGGAATLADQFFVQHKATIARIGGRVVILFGLATLGMVRIPWFGADTRTQISGHYGPFAGSALMGIFLPRGGTPITTAFHAKSQN